MVIEQREINRCLHSGKNPGSNSKNWRGKRKCVQFLVSFGSSSISHKHTEQHTRDFRGHSVDLHD